MRVNHPYGCGGALACLADYDVHAAKVFGRTEERSGVVPLVDLAAHVMNQEPLRKVKRVFWIVDSASQPSTAGPPRPTTSPTSPGLMGRIAARAVCPVSVMALA